MAGFQRYSPESQCIGKRYYRTKAAAKTAAKQAEQNFGRMHPYRCGWCELWHIGHKPPRELRRPA